VKLESRSTRSTSDTLWRMANIGCFSYSGVGHVSPLLALARRLQRRGHSITFFQLADLKSRIEVAGIRHVSIGEDELPAGSLARELEDLSRLEGAAAFERVIASVTRESLLVLRDAPELLRKHEIDFILVDECCDAAATVARTRRVPFVSLALALTRYDEPTIPYWACPLPYSNDPEIIAQYKVWSDLVNAAAAPLRNVVNGERNHFGLPPIENVVETHSDLATISQQPAAFDFPRHHLPATFHYTGPFVDSEGRPKVDFPWKRLDDRPLVYASLGTLQNNLPSVFRTIAEACASLDVQLVMGLGGGLEPERLGELPGHPVVLSYVPQPQLLERAALMITHAGMNSTLECLTAGVPMVAIPITHDQPTIAQRIVWTRTGEMVALGDLTVEHLRSAIRTVLSDSVYRNAALRLKQVIRTVDGLTRAVQIVETIIETGKPVLRDLQVHAAQ
jgi:zeaxanthin glucosyltransferase